MAARGINKVILVGNLGNEPDVRPITSGGAVTNISIATSETWKDKNTGDMQERTEWHRVVFFGKLGEIAGQYECVAMLVKDLRPPWCKSTPIARQLISRDRPRHAQLRYLRITSYRVLK